MAANSVDTTSLLSKLPFFEGVNGNEINTSGHYSTDQDNAVNDQLKTRVRSLFEDPAFILQEANELEPIPEQNEYLNSVFLDLEARSFVHIFSTLDPEIQGMASREIKDYEELKNNDPIRFMKAIQDLLAIEEFKDLLDSVTKIKVKDYPYEIVPQTLTRLLPYLKKFIADSGKIRDLEESFSENRLLTSLSVVNNEIASIGMSLSKNLMLRHLVLSGNKLTTLEDVDLPPYLGILDLSYNPLRIENGFSLKGLPNLISLNLSGVKFDPESLTCLLSLYNLVMVPGSKIIDVNTQDKAKTYFDSYTVAEQNEFYDWVNAEEIFNDKIDADNSAALFNDCKQFKTLIVNYNMLKANDVIRKKNASIGSYFDSYTVAEQNEFYDWVNAKEIFTDKIDADNVSLLFYDLKTFKKIVLAYFGEKAKSNLLNYIAETIGKPNCSYQAEVSSPDAPEDNSLESNGSESNSPTKMERFEQEHSFVRVIELSEALAGKSAKNKDPLANQEIFKISGSLV